jgi:hypothetical protein
MKGKYLLEFIYSLALQNNICLGQVLYEIRDGPLKLIPLLVAV